MILWSYLHYWTVPWFRYSWDSSFYRVAFWLLFHCLFSYHLLSYLSFRYWNSIVRHQIRPPCLQQKQKLGSVIWYKLGVWVIPEYDGPVTLRVCYLGNMDINLRSLSFSPSYIHSELWAHEMFDLKWWDNLMDCRQVACLKYDIFNQQTYNPPNSISQLFLVHRPNLKNDLKTRQKAIHPWSAIMQCRDQTGMFTMLCIFSTLPIGTIQIRWMWCIFIQWLQ